MTKDQVVGGVIDAAKAAPPVTLSWAWLAGWNLNEILVAVTIAYTVILLVHRMWHWTTPPTGKK